jgi:hypothetical protein
MRTGSDDLEANQNASPTQRTGWRKARLLSQTSICPAENTEDLDTIQMGARPERHNPCYHFGRIGTSTFTLKFIPPCKHNLACHMRPLTIAKRRKHKWVVIPALWWQISKDSWTCGSHLGWRLIKADPELLVFADSLTFATIASFQYGHRPGENCLRQRRYRAA